MVKNSDSTKVLHRWKGQKTCEDIKEQEEKDTIVISAQLPHFWDTTGILIKITSVSCWISSSSFVSKVNGRNRTISSCLEENYQKGSRLCEVAQFAFMGRNKNSISHAETYAHL